MLYKRVKHLSDCIVFFDFDNTITPFDILDDIIERFSINKDWIAIEQDWKLGKIGSKECIKGQLRSVRISKKGLLRYLSKVKINPYFNKLLFLLKKAGVRFLILSDNFHFIINYILKNNGIRGITVCANILKFNNDRINPVFNRQNRHCGHCGHCKTKNLLNKDFRDKIIIYIGDGLSDVCPAQKADIVFAKSSLLKHFRRGKIPCIPFKGMNKIYNYFKETYESEPKSK